VLNNLDMPIEEFVGKFRRGGIWAKLGSEVRGMSVEDAIQSSPKARKLLIDGRFIRR